MTDTPNARLARVLRLLADVAGKFPVSMPPRVMDEIVEAVAGLDELDLAHAERSATEAARLAGVPLDGWYTSEPPMGVMCLVTSKNGFLYVGKFDGSSWSVENFLDLWPNEVAAWRPLPEPYRPEEKTDEQR